MASEGLRPFGHALAQFMMVWAAIEPKRIFRDYRASRRCDSSRAVDEPTDRPAARRRAQDSGRRSTNSSGRRSSSRRTGCIRRGRRALIAVFGRLQAIPSPAAGWTGSSATARSRHAGHRNCVRSGTRSLMTSMMRQRIDFHRAVLHLDAWAWCRRACWCRRYSWRRNRRCPRGRSGGRSGSSRCSFLIQMRPSSTIGPQSSTVDIVGIDAGIFAVVRIPAVDIELVRVSVAADGFGQALAAADLRVFRQCEFNHALKPSLSSLILVQS